MRRAGLPDLSDPQQVLAVRARIDACARALETGRRLHEDLRRTLANTAHGLDPAWQALPGAVEAFLCDGAPWTLTCTDLEPLRATFTRYGAWRVFDRLWALALTNEPAASTACPTAITAGPTATTADPAGATAAATAGVTIPSDRAVRVAAVFEPLRASLDDPGFDAAPVLQAVATELHGQQVPGGQVARTIGLLTAAVAAAQAAPPHQSLELQRLLYEIRHSLRRWPRSTARTAWVACGRRFLGEVLQRLAGRGHAAHLAAQADVLAIVFDAPQALLFKAHPDDALPPLHAVRVSDAADAWLRFLRQRIDPATLSFEDRIRHEVACLKLLRGASSTGSTGSAALAAEWLAAFEQLRMRVAHAVPPAQRALPAMLAPLLLDFFVESVAQLQCEGAALRTTETLARSYPRDFRLACLLATGALVHGEGRRLEPLHVLLPRTHVDAALFARCAFIWARLPGGAKLTPTLRRLLFDPLEREHRKRCLLQLGRHALRHAADPDEYHASLRQVAHYFGGDGVYTELRDRIALESELVYLAAMLAPVHHATRALTGRQSRQWASHAVKVAAQSPFGAALGIRHLEDNPQWLPLAPAVRRGALQRLEALVQLQGTAKPPAQSPVRRRKPAAATPQQRGLFDDIGAR